MQLEPITDEGADTDRADQGLYAAADTELPSSPGLTPSPRHKRAKAAEADPEPNAATQLRGNSSIIAAAVVLLLAVAGAVLWPRYGTVMTESAQQALQASSSYIEGLQLQQQLSAVYASVSGSATNTVELLQSQASGLQKHLHTVLLQLHVKYPTLVTDEVMGNLKSFGFSAPTVDHNAWAAKVLTSILPEGQQWQELATDISDKLLLPAAARSHKATALMLACASSEDCAEAAAALSVLPPRGDVCSLLLNASSVAGSSDKPAAVLQAVLAPFLRRCPAGLVLLQAAEQLPVAAVPALQNALSELGGFQHDGKVDGSKAAYVLLLQLPAQDVAAAAAAADTAAADSSIKDTFFKLQQQLLERQSSSSGTDAWETAGRALRALHRRIDFAAPVKLGTAAEEALDLAMQAALAAEEESIARAAGADAAGELHGEKADTEQGE